MDFALSTDLRTGASETSFLGGKFSAAPVDKSTLVIRLARAARGFLRQDATLDHRAYRCG